IPSPATILRLPSGQGFAPTPRISAYVLNVVSGSLPLPRPLAHYRSVAGAAASGATSRMLSVILLLPFRG
ncbi:hypothetical protein, partial [Escherichia coli]|uniref:hypothetical protein n=1 Tax=Escherichia coli TaxID=562 RepID=UPI0015962732